ncbi:MAG: hypothetical protein EOM12_03765 [Verrucomicrobiae bacterium]|nr:hypothetical protein [Verrucomicrobiae bacterium]
MPKLNIDELKQLSEPIEVTLEGKDYAVTKISSELMESVTALAKEDSKEPDILAKQLGMLLGVDAAEFKSVDVRKLGRAIKFITETVIKGLDEKNA